MADFAKGRSRHFPLQSARHGMALQQSRSSLRASNGNWVPDHDRELRGFHCDFYLSTRRVCLV